MLRKRSRVVMSVPLALVLVLVMLVPAEASRFGPSGFPQYPSFPYQTRLGSGELPPFIQDPLDPHKWVWTLDPLKYGATGTITFYDYQDAINRTGTMQGPGGVGVNDFRVLNPVTHGYDFDFRSPSFTQDVDSVLPDFVTPDGSYDLNTDWDPTVYHPDGLAPPTIFAPFDDAVIDGSANLYKFGFSIAPGTQFMNMQVDKAGNYYVARRDMQWNWIDTFYYKKGENTLRPDGSIRPGGAPAVAVDTQFNIQPYPISDAYGWCGAIPPDDPNSLTPMAGQLVKDIAFDVYPFDGGPHNPLNPRITTVVPNFVMRSYGIYEVDVTMLSTGVRQQFSGIAKGVHARPDDVLDDQGNLVFPKGSRVQPGDSDFQKWFNRVSPFAAGVVPIGSWVINAGTDYMQVVPAGTPGAVWHQNLFAGAAFLVRGDMERRVNYILAGGPNAGDQGTYGSLGDPPQARVYADLISSGAVNPRTGQPWRRADWTSWSVGGAAPLPDAYTGTGL